MIDVPWTDLFYGLIIWICLGLLVFWWWQHYRG